MGKAGTVDGQHIGSEMTASLLKSRLNALIRKRIFTTATQAERIEALQLYRKLLTNA